MASPVPARLQPLLDPASPVQQLARRSPPPGTSATSWAAPSATRSSTVDAPTTDVDVTTDARPDVIERLVRPWADHVWLQGQRFGTVGCAQGRHARSRSPRSAPRSTGPTAASPRSRSPTTSRPTSRGATSRSTRWRCGCPSPSSSIPSTGAADLAARRLRTPLAPEVSFLDDPLRMLRAARFVARLRARARARAGRRDRGAAPPPRDRERRAHPRRAVEAAARRRPDARAVVPRRDRPRRRVPPRAERDAARAGPDPPPQGRPRAHDRGRAQHPARAHACGWPRCSTTSASRRRARSPTGGVSFHHHEVVGARMAEERLRALRYPNDVVDDVTQLVYLHLRIHTYAMGWTDKAVRRYVRDAGDPARRPQPPAALRLHDPQPEPGRARSARRMDELEARIAELASRRSSTPIRPPLDGRQVMAHLGVPPGRVVGDALEALLEARLDDGPIDETRPTRAPRRLGARAGHLAGHRLTPAPCCPAAPGGALRSCQRAVPRPSRITSGSSWDWRSGKLVVLVGPAGSEVSVRRPRSRPPGGAGRDRRAAASGRVVVGRQGTTRSQLPSGSRTARQSR